MIEFKEQYPKLPNSNQWGAALSSVVDFMGTLQLVVKKIDSRVSNLESNSNENQQEIP
jgi:hypothetical protein